MGIFKDIFSIASKQDKREELISVAFLQSPIAMALIRSDGVVCTINDAFTSMTGYSAHEMDGQKMSILKSGEYNNTFYQSFYRQLEQYGKYSFEILNKCKDGSLKMMSEQISKVDLHHTQYYIVSFQDITQAKEVTKRYEYLATHDPLTGVANRTLLDDRFKQALRNATRSHNKVALIMCDLNEFKTINDQYGHHYGDVALQMIAKELKASVRDSDTVARFGGDEFVLVIDGVEDKEDVRKFIDKTLAKFPYTIQKDGVEFDVSLSVGYGCFPEDGTTFEQLSLQADMRMYDHKKKFYGFVD